MSSRANIVIDQGSTFNTSIVLNDPQGQPIDLSGYSILAQIRKSYTSSNNYSFTTSANSSGVIQMNLPATVSRSMPAGRYVYDILAIDSANNATRVLEGQVTINPAVSRP